MTQYFKATNIFIKKIDNFTSLKFFFRKMYKFINWTKYKYFRSF